MADKHASNDFSEANGWPHNLPTIFFINAHPDVELGQALDSFRWEYERLHGPTP